MPIVLTGDVHHHIPSADRRHADESEAALAVTYAQIAARHGLKVTLYVTGLAVRSDADDLISLAQMETVEIGGHGWDAFQPRWLYRPLARISGSPHGFARWQRRSVRRTCAAIEDVLGTPVRSWRNHAYTHDGRTPGLLTAAGVTSWSDELDLTRTHPYLHESGLVVLPMNTLPDHENLYHGNRSPEAMAIPALHADEWSDSVLAAAAKIEEAGGCATVLAHPLCMKVVDDFATFDRLCTGLARYESLFATEAAERVVLS